MVNDFDPEDIKYLLDYEILVDCYDYWDLVKVLDKWDEELGALAKVKYKGKVVTKALSELSPKEKSEALSIYLYWFANK